MDKPRIKVDFNEMLEPDLVLLSNSDTKKNSDAAIVELFEGKEIDIYDECGAVDEKGQLCKLVASGLVTKNTSHVEWSKNAKWLCKIDEKNIEHSINHI